TLRRCQGISERQSVLRWPRQERAASDTECLYWPRGPRKRWLLQRKERIMLSGPAPVGVLRKAGAHDHPFPT
ncbi:MAG TPA: hypothetical protein VLJ17_09290, partial [Xanthobacteraceae bacterium]|nr:hypothetical protein [Xanthobacteraceae bacterium]